MRAHVRIFPTIFEDFDDPLVDLKVDNLRVQMSDRHRAGRICTIRSRLIHADGSYATDFEHDGASSFLMEFAVLDQMIHAEYWIEVVGVLTEVRSWDAPFVRDPDDRKEGGPWEGATLCEFCTGGEGAEPHYVVEHYTPPECKQITQSSGCRERTWPVYGRYIIVRWGNE